ncbi:MAG: SHOCT domain-containing protein [Pseudomonadota bacterium]
MQQLTDEGLRVVQDVAQRHGFSVEAVTVMLQAVSAGFGNQAQFNHWEFGGMGQWSSGGMVMIGDMFNNQLQGRVSSLCQELSGIVQNQQMFQVPAQTQSQSQSGGYGGQGQMQGGGGQMQGGGGSFQSQGGGSYQSQGGGGMGGSGSSLFVSGTGNTDWWPADLGAAGSVGAQNNLRYAYFPRACRLAIDIGGQVTVYDTGQHQIGGFSQQQSGDQSLTFTSQFGLVRVADLPIVSGVTSADASGQSLWIPVETPAPPQPAPIPEPEPEPVIQPQSNGQVTPSQPVEPEPIAQPPSTPSAPSPMPIASSDEIFTLIEKLADLRGKGVLTDAEFETKKAELLARL